jgi:hypothetical protein
LAELYATEAQWFGIAAFCGVVIAGVPIKNLDKARDFIFVFGFFTLGLLSMLVGFGMSTVLQSTVAQCWQH